MDKTELYDALAQRKTKPRDFQPYDGNNGRVNKCVTLIKNGTLCYGGMILDVGGGIGDLGDAVKDIFSERYTLDISLQNLKAASAKGNKTILADVDAVGFSGLPEGAFNLVTALDFIEHIIDPEKFARECYKSLRSGGMVFINTPNIRFWRHIEELLVNGNFPHTSGDREVYHGGHLAFFTYNDLSDIFGRAGFQGFEQIMDQEGFQSPPGWYLDKLKPRSQTEFKKLSMEFGCPNLLFKCVKP